MADNDSSTAQASGEISDEQAEAILADATAEDAQASGTDTSKGSEASDDDLRAELEQWRKHAKTQEQRAKDNAAAAKRLREIEDEKKTAEQKLNDQLAAMRSELDGYKTREVAQNAATEAGLPASMTKFIHATDPDEAAAQAKELAKHLKPAQPEPKAADLRQGARTPAPERPTVDSWLRQQAGRG